MHIDRIMRCLLAGVMASAAGIGWGAQRASAAEAAYTVTFAARQCSAYQDIMANRQRNNIMESLQNLGPDSLYSGTGVVNPATELQGDPACTPLVGWHFTLGDNVGGKVDYLSQVTNPTSQSIVTQPSTPELDENGNAVGPLAAAVTVTMTQAQVDAAQSHRLWVQGGNYNDPQLADVFGAGTYAFGALRCSEDNNNGDNVEFISFPGSAKHVFCYYYAVKTPPKPATIVIRKQLAGGRTDTADFNFDGNVSYNPGGAFSLHTAGGAPGSQTFVRGETRPGDSPWTVNELQDPQGWALDSVACVSADGTSTWTISGAQVDITLGAGDTATCTYTDKRDVGSGLSVYKRTIGGQGGTFGFRLADPTGATSTVGTGAVSTAVALKPVYVGSVDPPNGTSVLSETFPEEHDSGTWSYVSAECHGHPQTGRMHQAGGEITVDFDVTYSGAPIDCVFTNKFVPHNALHITKQTFGGTGRFTFAVIPAHPNQDPNQPGWLLPATTTAQGVPVEAGNSPLTDIPFGRYKITELPPYSPLGVWTLTSAPCGDRDTRLVFGQVPVSVTAATPIVTCAFTNEYHPYGTLQVIKRTSDPDHLRTGPVEITVACADGTTAALELPVGSAQTQLAAPLVFAKLTTCTVTETRNGATGRTRVATTAAVTAVPASTTTHGGTTVTTPVGTLGQQLTATFDDTYRSESPNPKPGPPGSALAETGLPRELLDTAALAAALLGTGAMLTVTGARARRRVR